MVMSFKAPRVISVVNQKGGVGKTTTAVNLATALAAVGKRVLLMDLDPQGNASTGLGISRAQRAINSYHLLIGDAGFEEATQPTAIKGLSIIPSTIDLSGAELELVTVERREFRLREAMLNKPSSYDYILLDCPPSLGLVTINALVASDYVMIPLQCEFYALEGLSHLLKTIEIVRNRLNPGLSIHGVVLTMYDRRNRLTEQIEQDVRSHLGELVYQTVIPRNVRMSEAPSHGKPAIIYDLKCPGSRAYLSLASEVLRRERKLQKEAAASIGNEAAHAGSKPTQAA
jgi:chromosome partitioning protein